MLPKKPRRWPAALALALAAGFVTPAHAATKATSTVRRARRAEET